MSSALTSLLCLALLAGLLAAALWHDLRTRRIPNRLVLWGTVGGVLRNSMLPAGAGLFQPPLGGLGLLQSLAGAAAGLALLLLMHGAAAPSVLTETPPVRSMRPTACQTSAAPAAPA